jgi:hypothetical protein
MIGLNDIVSDGTTLATVRNRTVLRLFDVATVSNVTATIVSTEDVNLSDERRDRAKTDVDYKGVGNPT